jgi:hypothetical protein
LNAFIIDRAPSLMEPIIQQNMEGIEELLHKAYNGDKNGNIKHNIN